MASESRLNGAGAALRFGFGPRAGQAPSGDARDAILAEIDKPDAARIDNADLLTSGEAARATFDFRRERRAQRLAARAGGEQAGMVAPPPAGAMVPPSAPSPAQPSGAAPAGNPPPNPGPGIPQQIYLEEAESRFGAALGADIGFPERWVWFWSNHFCISADKGQMVRAQAGAFEREAIRAHAFGRFADMLMAVEQHPAMLVYLDNARSIGPNSVAGRRQGRGLNENLAREILELHTLGVRSVYSQDDVTRFANVITGWTVTPARNEDDGGTFMFNTRMHEPGAHTVVGRSFAEGGVEQGRAVLEMLAHHPATAQHVASKIAQHFVADRPPPGLVERLKARFLATEGDLREVARALVTAPEAWSVARTKLMRPSEWIVSAMRCTGQTLGDVRRVINALNLLGEPLWRPSSPKGFPDDEGSWLDGLPQRLDIANQFARRTPGNRKVGELASDALGPLLSDATRQTLARAESRPQALALLMMSPELQRR